jgi:hypothetical protein
MRKLVLILIAVFLMTSVAYADDWYSANQATVRWDAVTTLLNGDPVPAGDTVTYDLYTKSVQTGTEIEVAIGVTATEYVFAFATEGDYHVGIRAVRIIPAAGGLPARVAGQSSIGWSSDPLIAKGGNTFGVSYYFMLLPVTGSELVMP